MLFDTQFIVTSRLDDEKHTGLKVLSKNASIVNIRRFLQEARLAETPGDRQNIDAILQVSVSANRKLYSEVREDQDMCQALRELMKDEIEKEIEDKNAIARAEGREEDREEGREEGRKEGRVEGRAEGRAEGREEGMLQSLRTLMKNLKMSAEQAMDSLEIPADMRGKYISML